MSNLAMLMEAVRALRAVPFDGQAYFELETLYAIRDWAEEQLPFKVGDRIRLRECYTIPADANGWFAYKRRLIGGATGTVKSVLFNVYGSGWQYGIQFDWDHDERPRRFSFCVEDLVADRPVVDADNRTEWS